MSHYVYRVYGLNGVLLYVGCSNCPARRMWQHSRENPMWFETVTRVTTQRYDDRAEALYAEKIAIKIEYPRYNVTNRAADHPESYGQLGWYELDRVRIALLHPEDCPKYLAARRRPVYDQAAS